LTEYLYLSGCGCHHPCQDLEGCGLACSVGTDEAEDFSAGDIEVDAVYGFHISIALP
jgi:hypothetical protein